MSPKATNEALHYLDRNFDLLVEAVLQRELRSSTEFQQPLGEVGRLRCEEDNRFHLHFLMAAITARNPQVFADYCGWVKSVLVARGIEVRHFERNLRHWVDAIEEHAPSEIADLIAGYLDVAIRRLPDYAGAPEPPADIRVRDPFVAEYLRRILRYDEDGALQLLDERVSDHESVVRLYADVLEPAQREVGRLWQTNAVSVAVEHYATAAAERILHQLSTRTASRKRHGLTLIGLCPESERHCLGLQMICNLARLSGWSTLFLGASTPTPAAVSLIAALQPEVVAMSLTTMLALQNASALVAAIKQAVPATTVLVGGRAIEKLPDVSSLVGADASAVDARGALALLDDIARGSKPPVSLRDTRNSAAS